MGGQLCELVEDFDEFIPYGIELQNDGSSDWGYMICRMKGSYVSNINGSFIVDSPFGRSYPEPTVLKVFANNRIGMFQTYASKLVKII